MVAIAVAWRRGQEQKSHGVQGEGLWAKLATPSPQSPWEHLTTSLRAPVSGRWLRENRGVTWEGSRRPPWARLLPGRCAWLWGGAH